MPSPRGACASPRRWLTGQDRDPSQLCRASGGLWPPVTAFSGGCRYLRPSARSAASPALSASLRSQVRLLASGSLPGVAVALPAPVELYEFGARLVGEIVWGDLAADRDRRANLS